MRYMLIIHTYKDAVCQHPIKDALKHILIFFMDANFKSSTICKSIQPNEHLSNNFNSITCELAVCIDIWTAFV